MANYPIYRLVKKSQLTFQEMDGNFEWLSRTLSASIVEISGSTVISGSLSVSDGITGYLFGTASWAVSSSYAINAISASYVSGSGAIVNNLSSSNDANINGVTVGRGNLDANFSNVAVGTGANVLLNSAASTNTSIGYGAGQSNIASSANTFLGWYAGNATTGGNNTLVGSGAGRLLTTGIGNIIIGRYTGLGSETNNYNTIVGHINTSLNASNNIILSDGQGNIRYRWNGVSNVLSGSLHVSGSITGSSALITGTITAETLVVQTITSSITYSSGSNIFGNKPTDTHQFTGSVLAPNITGSLLGTASSAIYAENGGVTKIVAGTNVTISPTNGLGNVTINSAAGTTLNGTGYVSMSGATVAYVASIPNKDLANSSITIQGTSTALGGSVNVLNGTGYVSMSGTNINYLTTIPNSGLTNSSITIQGASTALGSSVNVINGTGFVKASGTSITYDNSTYYLASNPSGYTNNVGTVTSVTVSAGSGLSGGGTVTSTGTITLTNAAPDQTVVLNNGTGISVTGTYPNFTIASTVTDTNIYNSNGSLSGNRIVTGGSNSLTFNGTNGLIVTSSVTNEVMKLTSAEPYLLIQADGATNAASIFLKPSTSAQNGTIQNRSGGGLEFYTGGTPSLAMTIGSNLNLGIGAVANISNSLEIGRANQWSAAFIGNLNGSRTPSQNYGLHFGWNYTGGSGESNIIWGTGTGGNPYLTFSSWNGTSKVDRLEIQDNRRIVFKNYTTTTSFTGTVVGFLGFDASGNILTTTGSGATGGASLSGGKINYNTIWNSTTTVSTGSVYQYSATQVVITGSSLAVGDIAPSATPGRIDATNDIVAYSTSDIRFKENIKPIINAVSKVNQISGVEFDWIEDIDHHGNKGHDIGVIAQELEKVLPEVVTTRDSGYKAVKYDKIVTLLIQAIKEQQSEIQELKSRIDGITK